jgi:hypothetical protein
LDKTYRTGRPSRVRSRWSPFGALVFAPWAGRHRLRDVVTALASPADALAPLGVTPPKRSTLAEAHARRPAALDHRLLAALYARGQAVAPRHGFRCNNPRCSVDRPTSALGVNRWPWARFRTAQGAITVHTRLEHAGHLPALVVITAGQQRALAMARGRERPKGRMVAMDRGDSDSQCLCRLPQDSVSCVTRQQVNATCTVPAGLAVDRPRGVTADQNGVLPGQPGSAYPEARRRGGARDSATGTHEVCWTTAW